MKQLYLALFLITAISSRAQTLTQAFNEPLIGEIDKNFKLDTSAYTSGLPNNVTGSSCNWNFTNLIGAYPMIVDSFIAPAAATGATAYPSASYAQHRDVLFSFYKSSTSPQQTELLGAYSPSLSLTFTNSAIIAGYPVNYGYNLTDPVSGSFKYNSSTGAANGSITIAADGTGTLNLPGGVTIPNVLRLKSVETLTLSSGILPFGTFNQTIYNYYKTGKKYPVLSVNYTTYQLLAGTPTITTLVYGSDTYFTVAGLNSFHADAVNYQVFPNPFHDHLFVNANDAAEEGNYSFYDVNGRLALKTKTLTGPEAAQLVPGIYFLETKNSRGTFHQKIIKE